MPAATSNRGGRGGPPGNRGRGGIGTTTPRRPIPEYKDGLDPTAVQILDMPKDLPGAQVQITDLVYIGSYNWINDNQRTIVVPGAPPEWLNKTFPYSVEPDFGLNYIDQNRHRIPSAPLLPLFKAVDVVTQARKELIDWPSVDFITDRNNLRKLLRWVHADGSNAKGREFRIDLQLAGKQTVLMNRWDKRITTWSDGAVHPGYGYNFEKASTRSAPGCEKTIGHNRIIKYNLGKFTLVVRFDVDAYLPDMGAAAPIPESQPAGNVDALAGQLAGMSVSSTSVPSEGTDIQIVRAGAYIQQNSIMELMTRTEKNGNFQWSNTYPQLFLSQTPHFFVAIQSNGNFTRLKRRNLDNPEVKNVGLGMQPDFRKLLAALEKIQEVVVASGNEGRYSLVHEGGDMKVYKRANQSSCLPEDVLSRFDS